MKARFLSAAMLATVLGCAHQKMSFESTFAPELMIHSLPSGAKVTLDGRELGSTPVSVPVPAGGQGELALEHPGYLPELRRFREGELRVGEAVLVVMRPGSWDPNARAVEPEDEQQIARIGGVLYASDKCLEAEQFFGRVLDLNPDNARAHKGLGGCAAKAGRRAEALNHYRRYVQLAPKASDAREIERMLEKAEGDITIPGYQERKGF